ncbi:ubiquitin-2 like Rad60 SUMO-like domain-containing protein [Trichoderma chlorosporum]
MSDEAAAAPARKKKLPFKPTALRNVAALSQPAVAVEESKRSGDNDDDGLDLFRQSREMAATLAAERERKLNRKKQRQAEEERRHSEMADQQLLDSDKEDASALPTELPAANEDVQATPVDESLPLDGDDFSRDLVTPPPSKRSRRDSEQGSRSSKRRRPAVESLDDDPFNESPSRRSIRSNSNAHTPSKRPRHDSATPGGAPPISVESDSDSDSGNGNGFSGNVQINESGTTNQREDSVEFVGSGIIGADPTPSVVPDTQATMEIEDDDDEFGEYVRKAEEQRARERDEMQMDSERAAKKDAAADIMVRSNIPNTKVAHIKYQFNRPLRLIRDSWIALQRRKQVQLPINSDDEIVLTWQRKKVYTYSSLLSLGIRPQGDGKIIADEYSKGGLQDGRTKVVLEAWTVESFNQWETEEEMRIKREAGELSEEEPTPEQEDKRTKLRVKLVAKDMEVVKLGVLLETTVETLMIGFRTQRSIGSDKDVGIWFDGERLEEHQTMEDAGIDDMDTLEVHIK